MLDAARCGAGSRSPFSGGASPAVARSLPPADPRKPAGRVSAVLCIALAEAPAKLRLLDLNDHPVSHDADPNGIEGDTQAGEEQSYRPDDEELASHDWIPHAAKQPPCDELARGIRGKRCAPAIAAEGVQTCAPGGDAGYRHAAGQPGSNNVRERQPQR